MKDLERVQLDDSVECLFGSLFGQRAANKFSSTRKLKQWKRDLVKLFTTINTALDLNLQNADNRLRQDLAGLLDQAIDELKQCENKDKLHTFAIDRLVRIVFHILGGLPDHHSRTASVPPTYWKLDQYRSLMYVYSEKQRAQLLRSMLKEDEWMNAPRRDCDLIEWFKRTYPERYLQVF